MLYKRGNIIYTDQSAKELIDCKRIFILCFPDASPDLQDFALSLDPSLLDKIKNLDPKVAEKYSHIKMGTKFEII